MSITGDLMELKEAQIREHYGAALGLLEGFDHTPRLAKPKDTQVVERSPGIPRTRRFRSTTPGLVTRSTARPEGVHISQRLQNTQDDDPLISPMQASILHILRRAISIALAMAKLTQAKPN